MFIKVEAEGRNSIAPTQSHEENLLVDMPVAGSGSG
jgi:hypothetical protein